MRKTAIAQFYLLATLLLSSVVSVAGVLEQRVDELIPVFEKGSLSQIKSATDDIGYEGLSSPRLFNVVENRLMAVYMKTEKLDIEEAGWLIKALSYSGNDKYRDTLRNIAESDAHKKVRGYAAKGLKTLERYVEWNPVFNKNLEGLNLQQAKIQRVKNTLASADFELVRFGAKRVYHAYSENQDLLALVEKRVLAEYQSKNKDKVFSDSMAWLCKALGASGNSAYVETLKQVAEGTKDRKIQKYAKQALKMLQ